jgi:hypothetical protein
MRSMRSINPGESAVALDNMPGALVYTDKDPKIVFCNECFKKRHRFFALNDAFSKT